VVVPDHYGFGLSDKPPVGSFAHHPGDHAAVLEDFVQAHDLEEIVLVVHDWGAPIGLSLAGHLPARIRRVVIANGFAWTFDPFAPGPYHELVDWSLVNLLQPAHFLSTGVFPASVGQSIASLFGASGSPAFLAVRDAYWGPFLDVGSGAPLSADAIVPTNTFAARILLERELLAETERNLSVLAAKPLAIHFGGADPLMGALRCDTAPAAPCPPGLVCTTVGGADLCLTPAGAPVYPYVERFLAGWSPPAVAAVTIDPSAGHFLAEERPAELAATVRYLDAFLGPGCSHRATFAKLASTVPTVGGTVTLALSDAPPASAHLVFLGAPPAAPVPLGACTLHVDPTAAALLAAGATDLAGAWSAVSPVPGDPTLLGRTFHLQALLAAPAGGPLLGAFELSNGAAVTVR
jgi:pimeloyl-ACP methyl ester carboxylesterase